jgi:hypothetical protein
MKARARPGHRLLNEVLRVLLVPGHPECRSHQLRLARQRLALEPVGQLGTHPHFSHLPPPFRRSAA